MNWITEYWAILALIISELLAFIPVKFSGIAQGIFKILNAIFTRSKKPVVVLLLGFICLSASQAQTKLFTKVTGDNDSTVWAFRPTIGITGMKMQIVDNNQMFVNSSLQTFCTGISYQRYKPYSDICDLSVNGLLLFNVEPGTKKPIDLGLGVTVGVLNNLVSAGVGWDFNQKLPNILLNISLGLN